MGSGFVNSLYPQIIIRAILLGMEAGHWCILVFHVPVERVLDEWLLVTPAVSVVSIDARFCLGAHE